MAPRAGRHINMIVMQRPSVSRVLLVSTLGKLNLSALGTVILLAFMTGQLGLIFGGLVLGDGEVSARDDTCRGLVPNPATYQLERRSNEGRTAKSLATGR